MTLDQALSAARLAIDEIAEQMLDKFANDLRNAGASRDEILALREHGFEQVQEALGDQFVQARAELMAWLRPA